ncbi:hypothetical protein PSTT_10747 [Puccinia striiformis]|uniref:Uncharacterized protein n=1 Tax=Puccinia striiformis TaxID=27350 RepID=A0A2S4V349_9BASI|nr:hypothetical protein PSTT_10747 [Puccinia striiformis]
MKLHYEHQKVIHICDLMRSVNLTPKKIMKALLTHKNMAVKTRRAIWGSNDSWDSTDLEIVNNIRGLVCDHLEGKENCKDYILDQAKFYVALDGSQHTNEKESLGLMQRRVEARLSRDQHVLATGAPFLYELIKSKVTRSDLDGIEEDNTKDLQSLVDLEGDTLLYDFSEGRGTRADRRAHSLRQDMAGLSGQEYIQQSHKCRLTTDSIDSFLQMAAQYDPFCKFDKVYSFVPAAITNIYKKGMKYIKENSKSTNIDKINRFNPAYTLSYVTFQIDDPGSDEEQELTTRTKNLN